MAQKKKKALTLTKIRVNESWDSRLKSKRNRFYDDQEFTGEPYFKTIAKT